MHMPIPIRGPLSRPPQAFIGLAERRRHGADAKDVLPGGVQAAATCYLPPGSDSCCITRSRLKLAGFCRIGNSLKLSSHLAAKA